MPARARRATAAPKSGDGEVPGDVTDLRPAPRPRAKAAARRVVSAATEPEVRMPESERATEVEEGVLSAPIRNRNFRIQTRIGLMPLMQWAASLDGFTVGNFGQLTSLFQLLTNVVDPEDWDEFVTYTSETRCDTGDFITFVNAAIEATAAYPTEPPASS